MENELPLPTLRTFKVLLKIDPPDEKESVKLIVNSFSSETRFFAFLYDKNLNIYANNYSEDQTSKGKKAAKNAKAQIKDKAKGSVTHF